MLALFNNKGRNSDPNFFFFLNLNSEEMLLIKWKTFMFDILFVFNNSHLLIKLSASNYTTINTLCIQISYSKKLLSKTRKQL